MVGNKGQRLSAAIKSSGFVDVVRYLGKGLLCLQKDLHGLLQFGAIRLTAVKLKAMLLEIGGTCGNYGQCYHRMLHWLHWVPNSPHVWNESL